MGQRELRYRLVAVRAVDTGIIRVSRVCCIGCQLDASLRVIRGRNVNFDYQLFALGSIGAIILMEHMDKIFREIEVSNRYGLSAYTYVQFVRIVCIGNGADAIFVFCPAHISTVVITGITHRIGSHICCIVRISDLKIACNLVLHDSGLIQCDGC